MKTIVLDLGELPADLRAAVRELRAEAAFCEGEGAVLTWEKGERLRARIEGNRAVVTAPTRAAFFKGFAYLLCGGCDLPVYADRLSFMADLSRNAVLKEETVRKLLRVLRSTASPSCSCTPKIPTKLPKNPISGICAAG